MKYEKKWVGMWSKLTFVSSGDKQVLRLENMHLLDHHGFVKHLHWRQGLCL